MVFGILLFLILSSGSVLAAAYADRRYEEALPLTIFGIMAVFYFLGIFGALKSGLYTVLALAAAAYLLAGYQVIRRRDFFPFLKRIFTPGFCFFALMFLLAIFSNKGMTPHWWDEFSHWGDTVKVMTMSDAFNASSGFHTLFPSYPPAMSTFQYFMQVLRQMLYKTDFCEWLMYSSYHMACAALLAPCFGRLRWKNISGILFCALGAALIPLAGYANYYNILTIDAFLALLAGFCMAYPFAMEKKRGWLQISTLASALFILVLTKQTGVLFALTAAAAYLAGLWMEYRRGKAGGQAETPPKRLLVYAALAIGAILLAKGSWEIYLSVQNAPLQFDGEVSLSGLFRVLFESNPADTYRRETALAFSNWLGRSKYSLGDTGISVSFLLFSAILLLGKTCLAHQEDKQYPREKIIRKTLDILCITTYVLYAAGMCIMYMFKFTVEEAVGLSNIERYMKVIILFLLYIQFARLMRLVGEQKTGGRAMAAATAAILLFAPVNALIEYIPRQQVDTIYAQQEPYISFEKKALAAIPEEKADILLLLDPEDAEFKKTYWIMHYRLRPHHVTHQLGNFDVRDVAGKPFAGANAQELQEGLRGEYEYAMIALSGTEYIRENYANAFENPEEIQAWSLYRVTKVGKLVRVPIG